MRQDRGNGARITCNASTSRSHRDDERRMRHSVGRSSGKWAENGWNRLFLTAADNGAIVEVCVFAKATGLPDSRGGKGRTIPWISMRRRKQWEPKQKPGNYECQNAVEFVDGSKTMIEMAPWPMQQA